MRLFGQITRFVSIGGLCLISLACSLGTEVGNGFKPSKGDDNNVTVGTSKKSSPDSLFSSVDESEIVSGLFDSSGDFDSSAFGGVMSTGAVKGSANQGSNEDLGPSVSNARGLEFSPIDSAQFQGDKLNLLLVDLALTGCASPLYGTTPSSSASFSLSLSGDNPSGQVSITADNDNKSWLVRSRELLIERDIALSPTIKVTSSGAIPVPSYTYCSTHGRASSTVLSGYSGTFTKNAFMLTTSRGYTYLTWYVQDGPGDFITRLKRIELNKSPDASNPFVVISAH